MLPTPLQGTYQQYKADTDSVAAWLASTAKACGYPADLLTSTAAQQSQPKGGGRLKGKARKDAKKQKPAPNAAPVEPTRPKYIIAIKDFIPLAEYIFASTKPLISVPKSLAETIDRVIYMRSRFGAQLEEHGAEVNDKSDETHNYFIGVLEIVRSVLRPRMPTDTPSYDSTEDLTNRFSGLNVYEPSQEFLDAPDIVRPQKTDDDENTYEAEPQNTLEDAMIAYAVMLDDLTHIRSHIKSIWANYKGGFYDLATAAVVTNTGIDLARNLTEPILRIFEPHGGACAVSEKFSIVFAMLKGFSMNEVRTWGPKGGNEKMYDIADDTFLNANILLKSLVAVLGPRNIPIYKEGMFGTYDPNSDRSRKNGHQKFNEDQIILSEYFTEAVTLARAVPNYPVEDEFIRGIRELDKTDKTPFYLVFATQILLDVHHILRGDTASVFETLSSHTSAMRNDLNQHIKHHQNLESETWPASNERALKELEQSIAWIGKDPVFLAKKRVGQKVGAQVTDDQMYRIYFLSPILSGLLLFHYRAGMHEIGITVLNAWGSVTYPAHLYNALQQEGLLINRWQDMDVVRSLLGDSNFFVGSPPKNKDEYLNRFLLQMGYSASAITTHKGRLLRQPKRHQDMASRAGPRGIEDGVPVSRMFFERYFQKSGQVDLTRENVDSIISRSNYLEDNSEAELAFVKADRAPDLKKQKQKQKKKATDGGKLKAGALLKPLAMALTAEMFEFSFPYLVLHRWSWKSLRQIKVVCDPVLRRLYGPAYLDQEKQLPFTVGYILMTFAEDPDGDGEELMRTAAEVFNEGICQKQIGDFTIRVAGELYGLEFELDDDDYDSDSSELPDLE
ncbi:hypothetical protein H9Q72_013948 [Fusarium xylarioides]|uniref:DUF6604 domain-containing protein n=1 Tax=Fusarium xylarioides TaxID=221167 RepID=A0A9P7HEJ0_9HYPO|nr:hypothetical protein H9Q70_014230 [Fusarium xylarioides]KAG5757913.1 hypothetical protein H9Q72_013948 [Fusarium xylarioides]KAG5768194.1 hypothetical protein H9Q73_013928 [Fusarium xylarioides]KAG5802126.1 hypothetical protein H9Q71_013289 [Fusarium xylarioides]KAG5810582.1 hypothetical protein H9Q74_013924 [Fusarium xylarioides]